MLFLISITSWVYSKEESRRRVFHAVVFGKDNEHENCNEPGEMQISADSECSMKSESLTWHGGKSETHVHCRLNLARRLSWDLQRTALVASSALSSFYLIKLTTHRSLLTSPWTNRPAREKCLNRSISLGKEAKKRKIERVRQAQTEFEIFSSSKRTRPLMSSLF